MIIGKMGFMYLFAVLMLASCENQDSKKEDSKDIAQKENDDKFNTKTGEKDAQFVVDAVSGNYYEIRLSKYALQKSSNGEIKNIAQMMIDDHTAMLNSLKTLASAKSISIPNEDSTESAKEIKDLDDKKPADFDKAWTDEMIDKHKATVNKMENVQKDDSTDADIKSLVDGALPKVRSHLDMLNQCKDKLK